MSTTCLNCHDSNEGGDNWAAVTIDNEKYLQHARDNGDQDLPRGMMDKAETELYGAPFSSTDGSDGVCVGCHNDRSGNVNNCSTRWKEHLTEGYVAQSAWETVAELLGGTCGW